MVKSVYSDCFDSDLSSDFSLLYKDDWHVINTIQSIKANSKESFCQAVQLILEFIQRDGNKQELGQVAKKYKKDENKFEWIFTQAIKKVSIYTQKMDTDECERARKVLLDLVIAIIQFQVDQQQKLSQQ